MEYQTDMGFRYEIKDKNVIITELEGTPEVVEIPGEIDSLPVTELGEYLFAGKSCRVIRIPGGVKKIGRYGFYNCRELEELCFSSDFTDLGSGAFTGCHQIKRLEAEMLGEESGLKEILSEIGEELCLRLYGKINAVLWFPEYYEEGVENTPARILMTQVHGSGLYYRNCFQGKRFHFGEYDRRFDLARAQESPDFLREMVYGRLFSPWELAGWARAQYEKYLWEHHQQFALDFIRQKRSGELTWLLENYPVQDRAAFEKLLDAASLADSGEILSMLMEYGRKHFPPKRRSFEL